MNNSGKAFGVRANLGHCVTNLTWAAVRYSSALDATIMYTRNVHLVDFPRNVTHTLAMPLQKYNGFPHVRSIGGHSARFSKQLLRSKIGVLGVGTLWAKQLRTLSY